MNSITDYKSSIAKRTQFAYLWMRLINAPFWCLLSMLVFILYKNMHVSPLQITLLVALKPASSLLSPYWTQTIYQRADRIIPNLIAANIFRHLPFLFIPWIDSSWFMIFSFGLYMMLTRATIPAWMELFKYALPLKKREEIVSMGTTIDYLGTALIAVGAGLVLDSYPDMWRWLFTLTALLGISSTLLLISIPNLLATHNHENCSQKIKEKITMPWKQVWNLISQRRDFALFQIGFMFGGAGLMIMQPALPRYFIDILHLSFTEMGVAISLCKGIGVALTSPLWTKLFRRYNIFQLSALVTFFAALFPFLILATPLHLSFLYIGYIFYGVMQAGSELSWHMSGLVFAQEKDSSIFSVTNVLTVGIRGLLIPFLGALLLPTLLPVGVILFGALLCLLASTTFLLSRHPQKLKAVELDH